MPPFHPITQSAAALALLITLTPTRAHEPTWTAYQNDLRIEVAAAQAQQADTRQLVERRGRCQLTLTLVDRQHTNTPRPGMIRITTADGQPLVIDELLNRALGLRNAEQARRWHILNQQQTLTVPQTRIVIEAIAGLKTETTRIELDLTHKARASEVVPLKDFYDPASRGLVSGNTHLHLRNMTLTDANRYLASVPRADNLDLTFVSHLERVKQTPTYTSNRYTPAALEALSNPASGLFAYGQEHRHNFGAGGEGYGHVMFLDIQRLVQPVSIGPGISGRGTDAPPLQRGIHTARQQGATILWCHNTNGYEDVPNWVAGLVHAQNIFDGGTTHGYEESFYRYLNLGIRAPFSTGTDWFMYDFARVYARLDKPLTTDNWLASLKNGRTYITNGPFLELEVDGQPPGETLAPDAPRRVIVNARALGRADFQGIQLIHNGKVVASTPTHPNAGHFESGINTSIEVSESGWIALRIPGGGENELGRPLFAHTSAVYLQVNNQPRFDPDVARQLIDEMRRSIIQIERQGIFTNDTERETVTSVYRQGITTLQAQLTR